MGITIRIQPLRATLAWTMDSKDQLITHPIMGSCVAPGTQGVAECRKPFEESPAYSVLHGMLETKYRVQGEHELHLIGAASSRCFNMFVGCATVCCASSFDVPSGHVRLGTDGSGQYLIFGSGVHYMMNPFMTVEAENVPLTKELIKWG